MRLGVPYIVSLRGSDVPFYNERFAKVDRLLFKRLSCKIWRNADAVVANSSGLRELALKSAPDQKIETVFNGVDTEKFVPATKPKNNDRIVLFSTGRLIQRKGYQYLIEALSCRNEFELWLAGDGNMRDQLAKQATDAGVDVKFLGRLGRSAVIERLQKADLFVLPSLNEGMSNSILEAISCGLAVVATDVGGSAELVAEHSNGFLVNKASSESLLEALEHYSANRDLIASHGLASRKRAEQMSWAKMANQYLEIYSRIIA
jgi:L-malate glycosyltransferase